MWIDTHTHLYVKSFKPDQDIVMRRAIDADVKMMLLPNIDLDTMPDVLDLHNRFADFTRPMLGLHPCDVKPEWESEVQNIFAFYNEDIPYCAVGEIGLDFHWDTTYIAEQEAAFLTQCQQAVQWNLPVVIHSRKSMHRILDMLETERITGLRGVFHCFGGTIKDFDRITALDFYVGLGGTITYKGADLSFLKGHDTLDRVVLETDAPYLTPQLYRGKRNESSYIRLIADHLAGLLDIDIEKLKSQTTLAAKELFNLSVDY